MSLEGKKTILSYLRSAILLLSDYAIVLLSLRLAHGLWTISPFRVHPAPPPFDWIGNTAIAFIFVLVLLYGDLYRSQNRIIPALKTRDLLRSIFLGYGVILILGFYTQTLFISRLSAIYTILLLVILLLAGRAVFECLWYRLIEKIQGKKRVVIYGAGETGIRLAKAVERHPKLGYEVAGFIDDKKEKGRKVLNSRYAVLGSSKNGSFTISKNQADEVWLAMPNTSSAYQAQVLKSCNAAGVTYRFVPSLNELAYHRVRIEDLGGIPLFTVKSLYPRQFNRFMKRCFDIGFSLLMLILLAPLMGLFAVLIKTDSPGPAIFTQDRIGLNGKKFQIYKFRSLFRDVDPYAVNPSSADDPRITRMGRYLRKTSLDEIPQFINVLRGEMSVVGPRPEMPFIVDQYNEIHRERLKVKPGITGLWQISGDRAYPIHENVEHDLFYIEHQSLLLDIVIVFQTVWFAMIRGVGAR